MLPGAWVLMFRISVLGLQGFGVKLLGFGVWFRAEGFGFGVRV